MPNSKKVVTHTVLNSDIQNVLAKVAEKRHIANVQDQKQSQARKKEDGKSLFDHRIKTHQELDFLKGGKSKKKVTKSKKPVKK